MVFPKGEKPGGFIGRGQSRQSLRADTPSASLRLGKRVAYTKVVGLGGRVRKMRGHVEVQRLCKQAKVMIARRYFDPPILAADMSVRAASKLNSVVSASRDGRARTRRAPRRFQVHRACLPSYCISSCMIILTPDGLLIDPNPPCGTRTSEEVDNSAVHQALRAAGIHHTDLKVPYY